MVWHRATAEKELPPNGMTRIEALGKEILLVRIGENVYATQLRCTHEEDDLSNGTIEEGNIVCGFHFANFNPASGEVVAHPQDGGEAFPLKTYSVKIENGDILVDL